MISVIVPVYNTSGYLDRVIESLRAQDFPRNHYELIFVDNGSSDSSLEILRRHQGIRVFEEPQQGSYAARNKGVSEARGEILAFSDSDCFPVPSWLRAIDYAFRNNDVQVLLGPRLPSNERRSVRLISEYENKKVELVCKSNDPLLYFGHTNNMAVRRMAMDRFGPFVPRARGSDTIFVRAVVDGLSCDAVVFRPDMMVHHAEPASIAAYYGKIKTYAQSRNSYRHITKVRPLSQRERLNVFWETTRRLPIFDSVQLFTLLVAGSIVWWYGGLGVAKSNS